MSHTANGRIPREKPGVLQDGAAQSAAYTKKQHETPTTEALRRHLNDAWPMLDAGDLDLLIEHAERLVQDKREVAV